MVMDVTFQSRNLILCGKWKCEVQQRTKYDDIYTMVNKFKDILNYLYTTLFFNTCIAHHSLLSK